MKQMEERGEHFQVEQIGVINLHLFFSLLHL